MARTKKLVENQEKVATVAPESAATTTTSMEPVQLNISDLQLIAQIVDLASRRGAFQAAELSQVGEAYNKLAGFLAYIEATQKTDSADETKTETPAQA